MKTQNNEIEKKESIKTSIIIFLIVMLIIESIVCIHYIEQNKEIKARYNIIQQEKMTLLK